MKSRRKFPRTTTEAPPPPRPNKTSESYWSTKVRKDAGSANFNVTIMHDGVKKNLSLGTTNQREAARRAAKFYLELKASGWPTALAKLEDMRGKRLQAQALAEEPPKNIQTVGWFIEQASAVLALKATRATISAYTCALRCISRECHGAKKLSYDAGEACLLETITPEVIETWRDARIKKAGDKSRDTMILNRKKRTINATVRNAAALFSDPILAQIALRTETALLMNPFKGIKPLSVPHPKYTSKIEISHLLAAARTRFRRNVADGDGTDPAAWIVFILALFAGLRANEIDKLQWSQVDLKHKSIAIGTTDCFTAKTAASNARIPIEAQVVDELRWYRDQLPRSAKFVICPEIPLPVDKTGPDRRRLNLALSTLSRWLRNYRAADDTKPLAAVQKPIHELRKEAGSVVMRKSDIYQASLFLRHTDIQTTVRHYADSRSKVTVGLGNLLEITPTAHESERASLEPR